MMNDIGNGSQPDGFPGSPQSGTTPYVNMEVEDGRMISVVEQVNHHNDDDNDDDTKTFSSVLTAAGIHDVPGFFVVCFVILIGDMARGVMFPTLWPLVENLGGTTVTLGYAVAAFSFGRVVASPVFGKWSTQHGYTNTLLLSTAILLCGTLTYAQVPNAGSNGVLILAQTVLGVGSGTLGVTRAFVADVTAKRERTSYMAFITAVQYGGFTVTPFFGALFTKLLDEKDYQAGIFRLNMYTAPAYFMSAMVLFTMFLLLAFFQGRHRIVQPKPASTRKSKKRTAIDELANTTTMIGLTTYDTCVLGCMLLNVASKGSIASFETLGISYAETYFEMYSARAGTIVASCGTLGVVSLLCMGYMEKWFSDVQLICGGLTVMSVGILSLTNVEQGAGTSDWRYIFAIFLIYSVGYPIGHTAVIGMFSKIVGRRPQGLFMGWFAAAGSIARITFPIMSGYVSNYSSIITLFFILVGVLVTSTGIVLMCRKTLTILSS